MTDPADLAVVLNRRVAGTITHEFGRPSFTYADDYARGAGRLTPLSLSMPLRTGHGYPHQVVAPWLAGLLPENDNVRRGWAAQFGVSAQNTSALLRHMGRDCAGSVQIVPVADVDSVLNETSHTEPLTEAEIGSRLRELIANPGRWTKAGERWSLPGMQAKFTAVRTPTGWASAHGSTATTHIIKPGITQLHAQALNEHICQKALPGIGIHAAATEYQEFDGVPAIVITRYDRARRGDEVLRLHQEDMCQALSEWPNRKYASDGGPAATDIAKLLAAHASQGDVDRFTDAVLMQYIAGAPDGHSKNYSVLLVGPRATLAPIYDVASSFPYDLDPDSGLRQVAMPIAGKKRFGTLTFTDIAKFATKAGTDPDRLVQRTREMAEALPDAITAAAADIPPEILGDLADRMRAGVERQAATLDRIPPWGRPPAKEVPPPRDQSPGALARALPFEPSGNVITVVSHARGKSEIRSHTRRRPTKRPVAN